MRKLFWPALALIVLALQVSAADEPELTKREKKIVETSVWLTNQFAPWITNTFPDARLKPWPAWFNNPPPGFSQHRFPEWMTNTFPQIDSEEFPYWLNDPDDEWLAKGIPDWWKEAQSRIPIVPAAKNLIAITRGPYLQLGTTNSMVVRWRTERQTASEVAYGFAPGKLNRHMKAAGSLTEHIVLFTNLLPDTKYFYSIGTRDTPLIVTLSNDLVSVRTTNGLLYVSSRATNLEIVSVTNGTLNFSIKNGRISLSSPDGSVHRDTTNRALLVSTLTSLGALTISNGSLAFTTPDHILPMDDGRWGSRSKPTRHFAVGMTNNSFSGGDSNTFFITHPLIGTPKPTRVWVVGDPGTRKKAEFDVRDAYAKWTGDRATDLWLMLGDNAYGSGKDDEYQGAIFQVFDAMLRKSVLWPCIGNHDAGSASSTTQSGVYYDIFTLPAQAQAGGVMSGTEAYYSWDYANIHFVCLDSSDSNWSEDGLMVRWLKADLEANKQMWLVAFCHHPPYTKGSHDSDKDKDSDARMRKMREVVLPLLEDHGLDLMLTGHSHAYERSFLLDGAYSQSWNVNGAANFKSSKDGRADGQGIYTKPTRGNGAHEGAVYVVAGSSGQISGGGLQHPVMCLSLNVLGSLVLDFNDNRMDATFVDDKAQVRDYFTIEKGVK